MTYSNEGKQNVNSKTLIILFSRAKSSTGKISTVITEVLNAEVKAPEQIKPNELNKYELIGFGSGIYDQKHHVSLLQLTDEFPVIADKKAFIFSTSGIARSSLLKKNGEPKNKNPNFTDPHTALRKKLLSKGFIITGEFNCKGFNDNSFLKIFGGMNRGRPNTDDLQNARLFAETIKIK